MVSCRTILIGITTLSSLSMLHISLSGVHAPHQHDNYAIKYLFTDNILPEFDRPKMYCNSKSITTARREKPFHPIKPQHDDDAREAHFRQTSLKHGCVVKHNFVSQIGEPDFWHCLVYSFHCSPLEGFTHPPGQSIVCTMFEEQHSLFTTGGGGGVCTSTWVVHNVLETQHPLEGEVCTITSTFHPG